MTIALLDPRLWLTIVIWSVLTAGLAYSTGARHERKSAEVRELKASNEAQALKIEEDAKTRTQQRLLVRQMDNIYDQYRKEQDHAKATTQRLLADVRADTIRLLFPIHPDSAARAGTDITLAGGAGGERYAELDRHAAEILFQLTERGDSAIRKHAAVVDLYEAARHGCAKELTD